MTKVLESKIETRLKLLLENRGFKVLKLVTQGTAGAPDRMILRPTWSPGPPWFIELKRPGKRERRLQELVREEWRNRGLLVLDMINTMEQADDLALDLLYRCQREKPLPKDLI